MNGQTIVQSQYGYYASGQLASIQDTNAAYIRSFRYDALARLARVSGASLATSGRWDISYGYDNYGNRTAITASRVLPGGVSIPPDGSAQLAVAPSGRITSEGFAYNAAGEITRRRGSDNAEQWLDYDQDGRLAGVALFPSGCMTPPLCPGGQITAETYRYAADRRRLIGEWTTSRPFVGSPPPPTGRNYNVWIGNRVLTEYGEDGAPLTLRWNRDHIYLGGRRIATIERAPPDRTWPCWDGGGEASPCSRDQHATGHKEP